MKLFKNVVKYRVFNSKNKWIKTVALIISLTIPVAFIGGFAYRKIETINIEGSSTLKPLIDKQSSEYLKTNKQIDINIQANGSSTGLKKLLNDQTNLSNYSEDSSEYGLKHIKEWKNKQVKTVTLAWDGIAVVYKKPAGCEAELVLNEKNINNFYVIFSGNKMQNQDNDFSQLLNKKSDKCNVPPIAYARSGGANKSGTAASFLKANQLLDFENFNKKYTKQSQALISGTYGNDFIVKETAESNSAAWSVFSADNKDGSMIYLSLGFVMTNWKEIHQKGFKVAGFQAKDKKPFFVNPSNFNANLTSQYLWYRPLNILASLQNIDSEAKKFVEWMLSKEQQKNILDLKFIPLTKEQLLIQGYSFENPQNLWKSDVEQKTFGAINKKTEIEAALIQAKV